MLHEFIQTFINQKKIPGAVIHVQRNLEILFQQSYGQFTTKDGTIQAIMNDTVFDLASLTKVVATLPSTLVLLNSGEITLDDTVQKFLPNFHHENPTIQQLLQHTSGLLADLYPPVQRADERNILKEIYHSKLNDQTVLYSDLGMILLGEIIQKVSGKSLDEFSTNEIFIPWHMYNTTFNPSNNLLPNIASTELVKGQYIQGIVHDEKAFLLQGISGSAGLFSCIGDLVKFAEYWLGISSQTVIPAKWLERCHTQLVQHRGLGFEVWNGFDFVQSLGRRWNTGSFGHTGFTGTSIWMDPNEQLFVVLLTNAIHFGRNTPIKEFRQKVHDFVYDLYIST